MPKSARMSLSLAGPFGPASLSDFATAVNAFRNSLRNVARCLTGEENVEYEVSGLRIGSTIVEAEPTEEWAQVGVAVSDLFEASLEAIQAAQPLDLRIDFPTLSALNGFSRLAKKPGVSISIGRTTLTSSYSERLALLLEPESASMGSVSGRLEGISIHGTNKFILYPAVAGEQVECFFEAKDLAEVAGALGREVTVFGKLRYAKRKAFPVRVDVEGIELMPVVSELPTLLNACGAMRSPIQSVDLIREARNEWPPR